MATESLLFSGDERLPDYELARQVLVDRVTDSHIIEIPRFDFLDRNNNPITTELPLGNLGVAKIESAKTSGKTHRLSIVDFPDESLGGIFLVGIPYKDTTELDRAIAEINAEDNEESLNLMVNSEPEEYMSYDVPSRRQNEDEASYRLRLDRNQSDWESYLERRQEKRRSLWKAQERIFNKYQVRREQIYRTIEPTVRHSIAFFPAMENEEGNKEASTQFSTELKVESLYLPYTPMDGKAFGDKALLEAFLVFLVQDKADLQKWIGYFAKYGEQFDIAPRLAIMSKLQVLQREVTQ